MMFLASQINFATRRRGMLLRAALLIGIFNLACFAQTSPTPTPTPAAKPSLTDDERTELLKLIRSLQERVDKLEDARAATEKPSTAASLPAPSSPAPA